MKGLKCVKVFNTRTEAELAKGRLQAENIQAIVRADDCGGMYPFPFLLSGVGGAQLLVREEDFARAQDMLAEVRLDQR